MGGYAQKARVKADFLVPLPQGLTCRQAMAVGTAGLTATLAVMALENHGLKPGTAPVLVTASEELEAAPPIWKVLIVN